MVSTCFNLTVNSVYRSLECLKPRHKDSETDQKLREAMRGYLEQIHLISQGKPHGNLDSILAPDCKKILNGKLISSNREAFIKELETVNKTLGNWTVAERKMVCSPRDRTVALGLDIGLNQKNYMATVFFHFNQQNLISALDETFTEANGSYQFDGGR